MSEPKTAEFGKWRSFFWPVHTYELKKLIPMLLMFAFINFNYTILRDTKDTLIVTAPGSGAEAIPFLKVWGVMPFAVLFMLIYSKLSNTMSREKLFYGCMTAFLVFFALFATVLYPCRDLLHPTQLADKMQAILPEGFGGLVAIFRNWTYGLFYVMAELWGSVGISLLFWGFANDITKVSESKRFYALFGIGANLAMLISGPAIIYFSKIRDKVPADVDAWGITLNLLVGSVVLAGIGAMLTYRWINKNVLTDPRFFDPAEVKKKKEKPSMSMKESFLFLARSKYIACIAILVIAYGISINIVEVTWKGQLKQLYPNPNDYSAFTGLYSTLMGIVTVLMMLFVGSNVLRRFGWGAAALFTPVALLLTGTGFFAFVIFRDNLAGMVAYLGTSPLVLAVIFGTIQNILSKSSKYSLFDPTKEMAYIPLDPESKVKGKAAIDVVGARLGKSGGSLMQQGLIVGFGSLAAITPYVAGILFVIVFAWIWAARSLSKQFGALETGKQPQAAPAMAGGAAASLATKQTEPQATS